MNALFWWSLTAARAAPESVSVDPWVAAVPYSSPHSASYCFGLFSGSETALFSLQPLDRKHLEEAGHEKLKRLVAAPGRPSPPC